MDKRLASYISSIGCVVPGSTDAPKRFAKELKRFWPSRSLGECHEATGHVYGHADWHSLDASCARRASSAPFDEELDPKTAMKRYAAQRDIISLQIAGLDPNQDYTAPAMPEPPAQMSNDEFEAFLAARAALQGNRAAVALARMANCVCDFFLLEQAPTAQQRPPVVMVSDTPDSIATQEFVADLPSRLANWWEVNVPGRTEVAAELRAQYWNKDRPVSILNFASTWGRLNLLDAATINFTMGAGTAYLLANQFVEAMLPRAQPGGDQSQQELTQERFKLFSYFYSVYPRDDFIKMGIPYHQKNARDVVKILGNPKSRRGTFKQ
jgi:hypothetical protein